MKPAKEKAEHLRIDINAAGLSDTELKQVLMKVAREAHFHRGLVESDVHEPWGPIVERKKIGTFKVMKGAK
jgi:hypothetical protein